METRWKTMENNGKMMKNHGKRWKTRKNDGKRWKMARSHDLPLTPRRAVHFTQKVKEDSARHRGALQRKHPSFQVWEAKDPIQVLWLWHFCGYVEKMWRKCGAKSRKSTATPLVTAELPGQTSPPEDPTWPDWRSVIPFFHHWFTIGFLTNG